MRKKIRLSTLATLLMSMIALIFPTNSYAATSVRVNWDVTYQTIDGFGISEAFHQSNNIARLGETKQNEIYDLLFSTTDGAGFSIFRAMLGDGGTWGNADDGPNKTMQPAENVWDWNESNDDQIPMIRAIQSKYGVNQILYSVWSPPAWMKTNNSVVGGSLRTDKYQAYATYLAEHIKNYKSKFGIEITHIGIQNEPNLETSYSSCKWTPEELRIFMRDYLVPTFDQENITAKVLSGESMNFTEEYAINSLNDPIAVTRTDIVAAHNYGSYYTYFTTAKSKDKGIWMTEVSDLNGNDTSINDGLKWAKEINDFMTITQGNAWFYWWGACFKTYNGEGLIQMDLNSKTYKVAKRLYTIGQFSRFIRPGWQRIDVKNNPVSNVYITAYKDPKTNKFAIVALNNGWSNQSIDFTLNGFSPSKVTPYTTSATQDMAKGSDIAVSNSSFSFDLAPNSITTFVGDLDSSPIVYGDVTGDGDVNSIDFAYIRYYLLASGKLKSFPSENGFIAADLDGDGKITSLDFAYLRMFLTGKIKKFPVEK